MVDQEHADLLLVPDRADDGRELRDLALGQAGRGLVEQQEPRLDRERPRDAELALVAVREAAGRLARAVGDAEHFHQPLGSLPRRTRPGARTQRRDLDVLAHAQPGERPAVLERARETGPAAAVRRPRGDVLAGELHRAGVREVEAGQHVHERRLAGSVRPDQADHLVPVQLHRHAAKRVDARERPRNVGGPKNVSGPPGFSLRCRHAS